MSRVLLPGTGPAIILFSKCEQRVERGGDDALPKWRRITPVSYTHLDVYKRQALYSGQLTLADALEAVK